MRLRSAMPMVFGLPLTLATCFGSSDLLFYVLIRGTSFSLLFSKLSKVQV